MSDGPSPNTLIQPAGRAAEANAAAPTTCYAPANNGYFALEQKDDDSARQWSGDGSGGNNHQADVYLQAATPVELMAEVARLAADRVVLPVPP